MKEQSKTLACVLTMGLQQGCTPSNHHRCSVANICIAKISMDESDFTYPTFVHYCILLLNTCKSSDNLWFVLIT